MVDNSHFLQHFSLGYFVMQSFHQRPRKVMVLSHPGNWLLWDCSPGERWWSVPLALLTDLLAERGCDQQPPHPHQPGWGRSQHSLAGHRKPSIQPMEDLLVMRSTSNHALSSLQASRHLDTGRLHFTADFHLHPFFSNYN